MFCGVSILVVEIACLIIVENVLENNGVITIVLVKPGKEDVSSIM